jgi:ABC-type Na+ efflux pump permease subunit
MESKAVLGVRHAVLAYAAPRALYSRVEDTGAYGWALVTLLALMMLIGYTVVQTGLIDTTVERKKEQQLAEIEKKEGELVDRVALKERLDGVHKQAEFTMLITRLGSIVVTPLSMLASFLLIASIFYAIVALTGRKPEYHTLMSICVYAGFIELLGAVVWLAMVLHYRTIDVSTSLGMLAPPGKPSVLGAVDPFRIWFWVLVAIGLTVTRQLSRRMAIASCVVMGLAAFGMRTAMEFVPK